MGRERDVSGENNDRNTGMKLLQSSPLLHQRQTKLNHLNSSFVPLSPADLETAVAAAVDRLQGNNPSFSTQQNHPLHSNRKSTGLYLSQRRRERERERGTGKDSEGGENSNILKYAAETKRA